MPPTTILTSFFSILLVEKLVVKYVVTLQGINDRNSKAESLHHIHFQNNFKSDQFQG